jgi:hypothetical protein
MFRVMTKGFSQEYDRWTDALDKANSLVPDCKGLFNEVRILEKGILIWSYSRSHKYPMYIGGGVYDRLARRFVLENTLEPPADEPDNVPPNPDEQLEIPLE